MRNKDADLKCSRILELYDRFLYGEVVHKDELAAQYKVNPRSIQRDIDELRAHFSERAASCGESRQIVYDRKLHGYRLEEKKGYFTVNELFAICKILLESRSLKRDEMLPLLEKLEMACWVEGDRKELQELIANEAFYYIEPKHGKKLLDVLWQLGNAVYRKKLLEITYRRMGNQGEVHRTVKPVGIMFSEFYFYLIAFIDDEKHKKDSFPTIYRVDRIKEFHVQVEHFKHPYAERFEEGEFRKRVQFMYGGDLKRVRFEYSGPSIEAVLDRLPTAVVKEVREGVYDVTAEAFGEGIEMWLGSQKGYIKLQE